MTSLLMARKAYTEKDTFHDISDRDLRIVNIVGLTIASISVTGGILVLYWFRRMRRNFRHDLIMVLIQADMLESLWFLVFPIIQLTGGRVESSSAFCQASGFFLALGIEGSDVAVILIAIHQVLFILRGHNGLYPFRHYAYAAVIIIPTTLASLAFLETPGYVNSGEYCYLPTHHSWSRQWLSWFPRYIIFIGILVTYTALYLYVTFMMNSFEASNTTRSESDFSRHAAQPIAPDSGDLLSGRQWHSAPPTPPQPNQELMQPMSVSASCEDLVSLHKCQTSPAAVQYRSRSLSLSRDSDQRVPTMIELQQAQRRFTLHALAGNPNKPHHHLQQSQHLQQQQPPSSPSPSTLISPQSRPVFRPVNFGDSARPSLSFNPGTSSPTLVGTPNTWSRRRSSKFASFVQRPSVGTASTEDSAGGIVVSRPPNKKGARKTSSGHGYAKLRSLSLSLSTHTNMSLSRDKTRKQLRQLFLYPLAYLLVWIVPFVAHQTGKDGVKTSFVWVLTSLVSLCVQCGADAVVFAFRERPWRHKRDRKATSRWWPFASSSRTRSWKHRSTNSVFANVGRTREEMVRDSTLAHQRREDEMAERRMAGRKSDIEQVSANWWDRY